MSSRKNSCCSASIVDTTLRVESLQATPATKVKYIEANEMTMGYRMRNRASGCTESREYGQKPPGNASRPPKGRASHHRGRLKSSQGGHESQRTGPGRAGKCQEKILAKSTGKVEMAKIFSLQNACKRQSQKATPGPAKPGQKDSRANKSATLGPVVHWTNQ